MLSVHRHIIPGVNCLVRQQCRRLEGKQLRASVEGIQPSSRSLTMTDPKTLWSGVVETYARAQDAGAAFKTPTKTEFIRDDDSGVVFLVRVSESLREKTKKSQTTSQEKKKEKGFVNPFLPYEEDLWVQHLSETHTLLLNKFNLVDHHLLVVTREFEKQEEPLNVHDVEATMTVMQVVPFPFDERLPNEAPIAPAVAAGSKGGETSRVLPNLPFKMFAAGLGKGCSPEDVCGKLAELTTMASEEVSAMESFNLLFTREWVVLVPRRDEAQGPCGVNALGFAGTLFVRSQEEIDHVKKVGPMAILAGVGFPNV